MPFRAAGSMKAVFLTYLTSLAAAFLCACASSSSVAFKGESVPYAGVWFGKTNTQAWIIERSNDGKFRQFSKIITDYKMPPVYVELQGMWSVTSADYRQTVEKANDAGWLGKAFVHKLVENHDSESFSYWLTEGGSPSGPPIKEVRMGSFDLSKVKQVAFR